MEGHARRARRGNPFLLALVALAGILVLLSLIGGFIAFVDALSDDDNTPSTVTTVRQRGSVSRVDYGTQWPFTVSQGILACDHGAVTFTADGTRYAVNSAARRQGVPSIFPIRAEDPATGFKKDLAPILNNGLELCG